MSDKIDHLRLTHAAAQAALTKARIALASARGPHLSAIEPAERLVAEYVSALKTANGKEEAAKRTNQIMQEALKSSSSAAIKVAAEAAQEELKSATGATQEAEQKLRESEAALVVALEPVQLYIDVVTSIEKVLSSVESDENRIKRTIRDERSDAASSAYENGRDSMRDPRDSDPTR